jgi:alpha-L-rhamnosidase
MMARGTTALWEMFDPAMPTDMNRVLDMTPYLSFSHGWSTGPTSFLSEYVLGVRSTSGGMKTVEIVPFLGDLKWIDGAVPAPQGLIRVRASKAVGGQTITLGLPPGIDAQVGLSGTAIFVNGRSYPIARRSGGISYVRLAKAGVYQLKSSGETKAAK